MEDAAFVEAFEQCRLQEWRHSDHVRMAWVYLRGNDEPQALDLVRSGIQRLNTHRGGAGKYHETMTVAWTRLISAAMRQTPRARTFAEFASEHPRLLDPRTLFDYYSPELLALDTARLNWMEPDRRPLP